jgi:hypothetical protein
VSVGQHIGGGSRIAAIRYGGDKDAGALRATEVANDSTLRIAVVSVGKENPTARLRWRRKWEPSAQPRPSLRQ